MSPRLALLLPLFVLAMGTIPLRAEEAPTPRATSNEPKMPLTGLPAAKLLPNICVYTYPTASTNATCRAHCDAAFGYYYSYVWMEAARSFETAITHDPECAHAWLGLHAAMVKWGRGKAPKSDGFLALAGGAFQGKLPDRYEMTAADYPLSIAKSLMPKAAHRTQLLIQAKLQERGLWPDTPVDQRKAKAAATLDELLTLYEDDQEAWFARAQVAEGRFGGTPFFKSLLKLNPQHPGAHHELVHFYENIGRPALGWPHALGYMQSSPGIAHAFHMQAHLGMRIGKWNETTEYSLKAFALQQAYHKALNVKPADDHQFTHHIEILTKALIHDGRYAEAATLLAEGKKHGAPMRIEHFRFALERRNWADAESQIATMRKTDKANASYHAALLALARGDHSRASAEWESLRQSGRTGPANDLRLWEIQGRIMCLSGQGDAGSKLLKRAVDKTKNDYGKHAWAGGAYFMELWGRGALEAGIAADAEEAYLEALAHDAGSIRAALGLWALCGRLERDDEAERYLKLARRLWAKADPADFLALQDELTEAADAIPSTAVVQRRLLKAVFISKDDEPCVSGTSVGMRCGPYSFLPADGPEKGKPTCYICEQEDKPTVVIFARTLNADAAKLMTLLDAESLRRKDTGFKAWMTLLTPKADLNELNRWSAATGLKQTPVGAFEDVDGPPSYKLAADAEFTVLLFVKQKVVANFALRKGDLTEAKLKDIRAALPKLFE